ncbi:sensor domain-containing diguanylate cyclase [Lichenihabitans sp. Uapishka_5]|uniref:sensor domain-containing diguanylate cyclase n=1 Tax=Lichenihabitans sp. Uapishka_5 TaxID=3037302 RepID=UPI0029E80394|nr:sensor domain-containing diguanylate cyclase [Lichenihabitans sp. Uapishka_5]MDX7951213.1 sensor domain-containing diguanylate cyclase [Lichenihabitans sp. Uapishka_5]
MPDRRVPVSNPSVHASRLHRGWMALGVLAPLGMLAILSFMLIDMRRDTWRTADQTSQNLLQVMARDIERNIELYDLSLQAVVENLNVPNLDSYSPDLRQLILFDRAATASDKGMLLVLDQKGDIVRAMGSEPPPKGNYADRDYFQAQQARSDAGLVISKPLVSQLTGLPIVALSRRINNPDGSFGGVVVGTVRQTYFEHLFDRIGLGQDGAINLFRLDGTRIARYPRTDGDIGGTIGGTPTFQRFVREEAGTFTGLSARDGVTRRYSFCRVGHYPLVLDVALSTREIDSAWLNKSLWIGSASLGLCILTIALVVSIIGEARRRLALQSELARLSVTDVLTELPNRRRFEDALPMIHAQARRSGGPFSLLVVDADHFKRLNDRFGHQVGDQVLKTIALCLKAAAARGTDLACRIGGEEFALLLPGTDRAGAVQVADRVHKEIAACTLWPSGLEPGDVTVSIGVSCFDNAATDTEAELYRLADVALYDAKANGRNQTRVAAPSRPAHLDMLRAVHG